jgi:hypothetical protein
MIEGLPGDAIKVLRVDSQGKVVLAAQESSPIHAFDMLGASIDKPLIIVEDALACEVVLMAVRKCSDINVANLDVRQLPGGGPGIKKACSDFSALDRRNTLVLLDGDQRGAQAEFAPLGEIAEADLEKEISKVVGVGRRALGLRLDGNSGDATNAPEAMRAYIRWWSKNVRFLPGICPDEWLASRQTLQPVVLPFVLSAKRRCDESKDYWRNRASELLMLQDGEVPCASDILSAQRVALASLDKNEFAGVFELVRQHLDSQS